MDIDTLGNYLNNIEKESKYLHSRVRRLSKKYPLDELEKIIFDEAFSKAYDITLPMAREAVIMTVSKVASNSKEYFWATLMAQLVSATISHIDEIIAIIPNEDTRTVEVAVDFSPLGTIEEYVQAVRAARTAMGTSQMPDKIISRSLLWNRIYRASVLGVKFYTYSKKGKKDITDKYLIYEYILNTRLNFISPDSAPFWELIEYGNATGTMEDDEGYPYPKIEPSSMTSKCVDVVYEIFNEVFSTLATAAASELSKKVVEAYLEDNLPSGYPLKTKPSDFELVRILDAEYARTMSNDVTEPDSSSKESELRSDWVYAEQSVRIKGKRRTQAVLISPTGQRRFTQRRR
jgi:hypothetical protein